MILCMIGYRFRDLRDAARCGGTYPGLIAVLLGALFYVFSHQLHLPRIAAVGLPLLLWGACHFLWGYRIYALMPLLTISAGWAYVAKMRMWQKAALRV